MSRPKWEPLEKVLRNIYACRELPSHFKDDSEYLKSAFHEIEQFWEKNFENVEQVRGVMLSESPLFGCDEAYFYNPDAPFTAFFHYNDAKAILGKKYIKRETGESGKAALLKSLAEEGFVILDLFPFAFKKQCTKIAYPDLKTKEYRDLFEQTSASYFQPKLRALLDKRAKTSEFPKFFFRYKRLQHRLSKLVESELRTKGLNIGSIGGTNMSLSRERLTEIWHDSCP